MLPCMEVGQAEGEASAVRREATPARIITTLPALMTALQHVVGPDNNPLVVATMVHLLQSGRLTCPGTASARLSQLRLEERCA